MLREQHLQIQNKSQLKGSEGKIYIIVRDDLKPGIQAAQAVHSIVEFQNIWPEIAKEWYKHSNFIAILSVKNEEELINLINKLQKKGLCYSYFREPDLENSITSICIEPSLEAKKLLSSLPLALKK